MFKGLTVLSFLSFGCVTMELDPLTQSASEFNGWQVADWGDGAALTSTDSENPGMQIDFTEEGRKYQGKGIVLEKSVAGVRSSATKVMVDIFNPNEADDIKIAIALSVPEYYESKPLLLKKGWNRNLPFSLTTYICFLNG